MRLMSRISTLHCAVEGDSSFFSLDGQPLLGIIKYKFEHFLGQKKKKRKRPIRHGFVCESRDLATMCISIMEGTSYVGFFFQQEKQRKIGKPYRKKDEVQKDIIIMILMFYSR